MTILSNLLNPFHNPLHTNKHTTLNEGGEGIKAAQDLIHRPSVEGLFMHTQEGVCSHHPPNHPTSTSWCSLWWHLQWQKMERIGIVMKKKRQVRDINVCTWKEKLGERRGWKQQCRPRRDTGRVLRCRKEEGGEDNSNDLDVYNKLDG